MKIIENRLPNFYLIVLYILTGILIFWGLKQLNSLLSHTTLLFTQVFDLSIYLNFIVVYVIESLVLIGLCILIIKVIRLGNDRQSGDKSGFNLGKSNLRNIGLIVLIISGVNLLITFITKDRFENDIATYIENNIDTMDYKIINMQLASEIIILVRKILIFILYFLIVYKLTNDSSTKANIV